MPQYPGLYANFTVSRFLWYMAVLKDVARDKKGREKRKYLEAHIRGLLEAVELWDVAGRKISALSGGMKQRLGLAQALLGDPDIIILDEPTAGLDPKQRIAIRNLIASVALNKIVLIATHVVSDVEFIASKVLMLKKGEVVSFDSPSGLMRTMEGKVWMYPVPRERLEEMQKTFKVIGLARDEKEGYVLMRVLSEEKPGEEAYAAKPTLEDCYLSVFDEEIV